MPHHARQSPPAQAKPEMRYACGVTFHFSYRFSLCASLVACTLQPAAPPQRDWEKHTLDTAYRAEGVAIFDVDRDGHMDIVTDEFWYSRGVTPHGIRAPETFDPGSQFGHGFAIYPRDIDGDGWTDIIVAPHPTDVMLWYQNPKGADTRWTAHVITNVGVAGTENPIVVDLFGDGGYELLMGDATNSVLGWYTPAADVNAPWVLHPISGPAFPPAAAYVHGMGAGDVDGDGKLDVLTGSGWFQQTGDRALWKWHPFAFGPSACSRMFAYDVDADGAADVICSRPHDYGLHWWRRDRASLGAEPTFIDVLIDDSVSQMHALRLDDLDGDGVPEIITGKRWWAHFATNDPGVSDPAVLVYYSIKRDHGAVTFTKHVVDDDSGVGIQFAVDDVDGDGKVDIVTSNKKGLHYFRRR